MSRARVRAFDWDAFWLVEGEGKQMRIGAEAMARRLTVLIERHDARTVVDFGCGSGRTLMLLARRFPSVSFLGVDAARTSVIQCREAATLSGLENIEFAFDHLPEPRTVGTFDLVYCIATLHYVRDIERAIRALWSLVDPGGSLVFNYPNRFTMHAYRRWVCEQGDKTLMRRFALVLAGENLVTLGNIRRIVGRRPTSLWNMVGEPPSPANVCILVRRPEAPPERAETRTFRKP